MPLFVRNIKMFIFVRASKNASVKFGNVHCSRCKRCLLSVGYSGWSELQKFFNNTMTNDVLCCSLTARQVTFELVGEVPVGTFSAHKSLSKNKCPGCSWFLFCCILFLHYPLHAQHYVVFPDNLII